MAASPGGRPPTDRDRFGFAETADWLRAGLGGLVPQPLARRAVVVTVDLDREVIAPGEPVEIAVSFRNRLPVPVSVATPKRRRWGWTVDGELAGGGADVRTRARPSAFAFDARERKTVRRTWRGRFRRPDAEGGARWIDAEPGEHAVAAFVATADRTPRASATVLVRED